MRDIAIKVENLSKRYRIGAKQERYRTMRDTLVEAVQAPFRRAGKLLRGEPYGAAEMDETIWALQDVSFEVERGEVVGIIGRNGAGKTTLLKILTRISEPTEGRAEIHGRVGSLLEVGTGFHPELTGRENVYLNGAILGMTRAEIDRKFDEIVDFSGVEKFIDTPVKHYSSGMHVRLAFAVAAHLDPEILLIDEVLAVGDAEFQQKCLGKMGEVAREGRTVLFVSHNMPAIVRLCERGLWLDNGRLRTSGAAERIVSTYLMSNVSIDGERVWPEGIANPSVGEFGLLAVRVKDAGAEVTGVLDAREPFWVEIEYAIRERVRHCRIGMRLSTAGGTVVFTAYDADCEEYAGPREAGQFTSRCKVPGNLLNPGKFVLSVNAGIPNVKNLAFIENVLSFEVRNSGAVGSHMGNRRSGVIRPRLKWEVVSNSTNGVD